MPNSLCNDSASCRTRSRPAFCGSFRSEGANDYVPLVPYRARYLANVGEAVRLDGQEMEDSPVVPNIVS